MSIALHIPVLNLCGNHKIDTNPVGFQYRQPNRLLSSALLAVSMKLPSPIKLLPLFLPLLACSANLSSDTVLEVEAPSGEYGVEVISGIPSSAYGPHPVRVYVTQGAKEDLLIRTPVFNDGKPLKKENVEARFDGNTVYVCLKGSVQLDKLITFNFRSKDYSVKEGSCSP